MNTVIFMDFGKEKYKEKNMKYECELCGWIYDELLGDPENGIPAGTLFTELPEDFICPYCGAGKEEFYEAD